MVLTVDVGNTNTVLGLYEGDGLTNLWRMDTNGIKTSDETGIFIISLFKHWEICIQEVTDVVISSVVPNVMSTLYRCFQKYVGTDPMLINVNMKMDIKFNAKLKNEMGADRIVNAVASYKKYGGEVAVMNIDFGTATTYDIISHDGEFLTGITTPGIRISAEALFARTALLGKVEIAKPDSIVAKNTIESLQSGIVYGHIGQTEYIISKLKEELNLPKMIIVGTGGLSKIVGSGTSLIDIIDTNLTLDGIKILHDMNK